MSQKPRWMASAERHLRLSFDLIHMCMIHTHKHLHTGAHTEIIGITPVGKDEASQMQGEIKDQNGSLFLAEPEKEIELVYMVFVIKYSN